MDFCLVKILLLLQIFLSLKVSAVDQKGSSELVSNEHEKYLIEKIINNTHQLVNSQNVQYLSNYYFYQSSKIVEDLGSNYTRDYDCVGRNLHIDKIGKNYVTDTTGFVLTMSALNRCYGQKANEVFNKYAKILKNKLTENYPIEDIDCAKMRLKKLEPESKLVADFNTDEVTSQRKDYCKSIFQSKSLREIYLEIKNVELFKCNKIDEKQSAIVDLSLIIIQFEQNKDLKLSEFKRIVKLFSELFNFTADCIFPGLGLNEENVNEMN